MPRPPGGSSRTFSFAPTFGSPSIDTMNGFQLGNASNAVSVSHTWSGVASISTSARSSSVNAISVSLRSWIWLTLLAA